MIWSLFILSFVQVHAAVVPETAAVKIESSFMGLSGIENRTEGSGLVYRDGGRLFVLSSEHVILPSARGARQLITTARGCTARAVFVDSNWDRGLALLEIDPTKTACFGPDVPNRADLMNQGKSSPILTGLGYPVGTNSLVRKIGRSQIGVAAGEVLFAQRVSAANFLAEFGMSGGPVFSSDRAFRGILTHVATDRTDRSYFIPAADALAWVSSRPAPEFRRTWVDFGELFYSAAKPEKVRHAATGLTFSLRNNLLIVEQENVSRVGDGKFQKMKFDTIDFDEPSQVLEGVDDHVFSAEESLSQRLHRVFSGRHLHFVPLQMELDFGPHGRLGWPKGDCA